MKIDNLAKNATILTSMQLSEVLAKARPPCLNCGSALFGLSKSGGWICAGCDPDRAYGQGLAELLMILLDNGRHVAHRLADLEIAEDRTWRMEQGAKVHQFFHNGQEWIGWDTTHWAYAARTFGLPIETIELWVNRTHKPGFNPDEIDFRRGTPLPQKSGYFAAWWPRTKETDDDSL